MTKKILEKKQKRIPLKIIFVGILLIFLFYRLRPDKDADSTKILRGDVVEELVLSGTVKADAHASLSFQTSGKISWVGVKEGERVKKGQALISLDSTNLLADLNIADSILRGKASSLDKVYDDLKGKEDSETFEEKETRTAAETAKDSAVFSHIKAQKNLSNATIFAPFEGLITNITNPYSGVNILFSQTQIEMVNPETIYFEVAADQMEVLNLKEGQSAVIVLDALEKNRIKAKISFISYTPMIGEAGTIYKVRLDVEDESFDSSSLRVGMTGDARFIIEEKSDVLYALPRFVNSDKNGRYVNLSTKNDRVYVKVGLEGEDRLEIEGDIKEGDKVYD